LGIKGVIQRTGTSGSGRGEKFTCGLKERKLSYYGHILRKGRVCLKKNTTSKAQHQDARYEADLRQSASLNNIEQRTGKSVAELTKIGEDRERWWKIVRDAANRRHKEG